MSSHAQDDPNDEPLVVSRTDVGRVRVVNEDSWGSYLRADGARLLVVADGMGGHRGGATASREALAAIAASFHERSDERSSPATLGPADVIRQAIERANEFVFAMSREDPELAGMGTTVVAFLLDATGRGTVAHVGDSRAYRLRGGRLEALTTDHSVVAEMLRRGVLTAEEAAYHPRRNEILRSVGVLEAVEVEVAPVELAGGDWILLCSDGLCGVVSDAEIEEVLVGTTPVEEAVDALIELANDCGGPDNVTVQLLAIPNGWKSGAHRIGATGAGRSAGSGDATRADAAAISSAPSAAGSHPRAVTAPSGSRSTALTLAKLALFAVAAYWLLRSL
jgi:serine/threonine protein phosphatase PrpC